MGDIADWILEGGACQVCGEYLGAGDGFAQTCAGCITREEKVEAIDRITHPVNGVKCKIHHCKKRFKTTAAMMQHAQDKHGC